MRLNSELLTQNQNYSTTKSVQRKFQKTKYFQETSEFVGKTQCFDQNMHYSKKLSMIVFSLFFLGFSMVILYIFNTQKNSTGEIFTQKTIRLLNKDKKEKNNSQLRLWRPDENKRYYIYTALNPVMVLDSANIKDKNKKLVINEWNGTDSQKFSFKHLSNNKYKIYSSINQKEKKRVMKVEGQSVKQGQNIIFDFQKNQKDEQWELIPAEFSSKTSFYLKSFSQKSLNIHEAKGINGQSVVQWIYEGWNTQIWILWEAEQNKIQEKQEKINSKQNIEGKQKQNPNQQEKKITDNKNSMNVLDKQVYVFSALHYNLVLDTSQLLKQDNKILIVNEWNSLESQLFYFKSAYTNKFKIFCQGKDNNNLLKVVVDSKKNSYELKLSFENDQNGQLWQLIPVRQNQVGHYYIKSFFGFTLNLFGGKAEKGQRVDQYSHHNEINEVWIFKEKQSHDLMQRKYEDKLIESFKKIKNDKYSFDSWVKFNRIKIQMQRLKLWLLPPFLAQSPQISELDLPEQVFHEIQEEENSDNQTDIDGIQFHSVIDYPCAKNHQIAYVWLGSKEMPNDYERIINKCKNSIRILTDKDFEKYYKKWNDQEDEKIILQLAPTRHRINMLKLLYLYYESGIYSDLDTQINEECFENIYTDQIIFTNDNLVFNEVLMIPEESFMMVRQKYNPQVKRMLEGQIRELKGKGNRWNECEMRQCLIINCQRHYRDNTYKKGFD